MIEVLGCLYYYHLLGIKIINAQKTTVKYRTIYGQSTFAMPFTANDQKAKDRPDVRKNIV